MIEPAGERRRAAARWAPPDRSCRPRPRRLPPPPARPAPRGRAAATGRPGAAARRPRSAAPRKPSASNGPVQRAQRGGPQRGRARGGLQMAGRVLVPPQAAEQAAERQARGGGLVAAPLRDQAFVDAARPRAARRRARGRAPRRRARRRGGRAPRRAASRAPRSAVRPASNGRPRPANASAIAARSPAVVAPSAISVARDGQVGVQRQPHRQSPIPDLQGQRHRVGEPPHALVERDRAPQLAALGGDARRLDVGAVRDEVFDYVGHLPRRSMIGMTPSFP